MVIAVHDIIDLFAPLTFRMMMKSKTVQDVFATFVCRHGLELVRGNDALAQLFHAIVDDRAPQLSLTDEENLQQRVTLDLEIGQDAQHLQRRRRKRLRFIHHQQGVRVTIPQR